MSIPEPFQFNPLKHHLAFIREFIASYEDGEAGSELLKSIKHIGTSVMDIYTGDFSTIEILNIVSDFLRKEGFSEYENFSRWAGKGYSDFRIVHLPDGSQWTLKLNNNRKRFVHIFPARASAHTLRVKSNTLKSAIMYILMSGKDYVTEDDLNNARALVNLSPVREVAETESITEMIEILRSR